LQTQALHFARADLLGDPYEGHYTRPQRIGAANFAKVMEEMSKVTAPKQPGQVETSPQQWLALYKGLLDHFSKAKVEFYVSSWHMSQYDSAAMWRLYTSMNESICISTTFAGLRDAFARQRGIARLVDLEPNEPSHAIFPGEPGDSSGVVLLDTAAKIVGHADVERTVSTARENVDIESHPSILAVASNAVHSGSPPSQGRRREERWP
jgi:hypothetical protein